MRIALVCPYSFTHPGGVKQHILGLYQEFKKQKFYVKILTPRVPKASSLADMVFLGRSARLPSNYASFDVSLNIPKASEPIKKVLAKEQFDIIHFHEPVTFFLSWQLLRASRATNIGTFHSAWQGGFSLNVYRTSIKPFEDFFLSRLDGAIAVSPAARDSWKKFFKRKDGVIIPNGIDLARFKLERRKKDQDKKINILFVGRLEPRKGVMDLLRAFQLLAKKDSRVYLTVVGWGPSAYRAKVFVKRHGLKGRVSFAHQVSDKKLLSYYTSADICCFPAIGGESFGVVLLEAMAMGKPLVVYANTGYCWVLRNYPWRKALVPIKNVEKLATSLEVLANDKKLRRSLGKWGLAEVKKYRWEKITRQVLAYYNCIKSRRNVGTQVRRMSD